MTRNALTDLKTRAAKPREKQYSLWDGGGLFLIVKPSGVKGWRFSYSFLEKKLLSTGPYPEISLQDARDRASEARKLIANGVDPLVSREAKKAATTEAHTNTFEAIAREMYLRKRMNGRFLIPAN